MTSAAQPWRRQGHRAPATGRLFCRAGLLALWCLFALSACHRRHEAGPPPHATAVIVPPAISSAMAVPVDVDLTSLQQLLDVEIPPELWRIDQPDAVCAPPQHVKLFGGSLAITPKMRCHITGSARRGAITLHGTGEAIVADVPILAHVEADHVGGLVSAQADGTAMAHARITLHLSRDWQASGTITLAYDWTTPPAVDLLGLHIAIADKVDQKLRPVLARLERDLPGQLARLDLRGRIAGLWSGGFAVVKLNGDNPPVWMRVVPQSLAYGGYAITGHQLRLKLGLVAVTQAAVGPRPADPAPTPLPNMVDMPAQTGVVRMFVPVVADYAELVPVVTRALTKRSARPFNLPGLGPIDARFANVEVYGASGGRIAVGADVVASASVGMLPSTRGRIWFAGKPHNDPGSQLVHFTDLSVSGNADNAGGNLLLAIADSPGFSDSIAEALTQNFSHDYADLQGKIARAIAGRRQGDLLIDAHLDTVRNEALQPYANGLYMPVWLTGHATLTYTPRGGPPPEGR